MKYKVEISAAFTEKADADALTNFAKTLLAKATNLNEGKPNEETGSIRVHQCFHDESPSKACGLEVITEAPRILPKAIDLVSEVK
jgi:hypothetical protein